MPENSCISRIVMILEETGRIVKLKWFSILGGKIVYGRKNNVEKLLECYDAALQEGYKVPRSY